MENTTVAKILRYCTPYSSIVQSLMTTDTWITSFNKIFRFSLNMLIFSSSALSILNFFSFSDLKTGSEAVWGAHLNATSNAKRGPLQQLSYTSRFLKGTGGNLIEWEVFTAILLCFQLPYGLKVKKMFKNTSMLSPESFWQCHLPRLRIRKEEAKINRIPLKCETVGRTTDVDPPFSHSSIVYVWSWSLLRAEIGARAAVARTRNKAAGNNFSAAAAKGVGRTIGFSITWSLSSSFHGRRHATQRNATQDK